MIRNLPWSHFTSAGQHFLAFRVTNCPVCGCQTQAPNAVNLHESRARLLSLGLIETPDALPERCCEVALD